MNPHVPETVRIPDDIGGELVITCQDTHGREIVLDGSPLFANPDTTQAVISALQVALAWQRGETR